MRERNELLDALAVVGGVALEKVTRALWQETATALRDIREVCGEVTPAMIAAAAARYRAKWPKVTLSPSALAKHWGTYGGSEKKEGGRSAQGIAEPSQWREAAAALGLQTEQWAMLERAEKVAVIRQQQTQNAQTDTRRQ